MDAKPLNFVRPEVPVELAAVVAKMLAKEPERRFQTPAEVAQALKPFFKKRPPGLQGSEARSVPGRTAGTKASAGQCHCISRPTPNRA